MDVLTMKKLKASSLIEIVVASIIILSSFVIAMSVISRSVAENNIIRRLDVNAYINKQYTGTNNDKPLRTLFDNEIQIKVDKRSDGLIVKEYYYSPDSSNRGMVKRRRICIEQ
jgi:hypothetical protein